MGVRACPEEYLAVYNVLSHSVTLHDTLRFFQYDRHGRRRSSAMHCYDEDEDRKSAPGFVMHQPPPMPPMQPDQFEQFLYKVNF